MNGYFLALIVVWVLGLGINMGKHGQSKKDEKYNFWSALIGVSIVFTLTYFAIKTGF